MSIFSAQFLHDIPLELKDLKIKRRLVEENISYTQAVAKAHRIRIVSLMKIIKARISQLDHSDAPLAIVELYEQKKGERP